VRIFISLPQGRDVPNAETIAAIEELERGGGKSFDSIEELMAELNADELSDRRRPRNIKRTSPLA
jgi:hypothetical protein